MTWRYYQYEFRASLRHACKHQGLIHTFIEKQTQTTYTLILAFFVPVPLYVSCICVSQVCTRPKGLHEHCRREIHTRSHVNAGLHCFRKLLTSNKLVKSFLQAVVDELLVTT